MPAEHAAAPVEFRRATRADAAALLALVQALAEFERLEPPDAEARERLVEDGFGAVPRFEAWLAIVPESAAPVGYAILFETYSSFLAQPTLYIEDLFVLPDWRRRGIGRRFLAQCTALALDRGCGRMEWTCLHWNTEAQNFYERKLGAERLSEWLTYRMTRAAMTQFLTPPAS